MAAGGSERRPQSQPALDPHYRDAIELVGKRWTGAILHVLIGASLRFSQIAAAIPELSDRVLSERMKELEARGLVERTIYPGPPVRIEYSLTAMGQDLEPALRAVEEWGQRWLNGAGPAA